MVRPSPWAPHHDLLTLFTSYAIQYHGVKTGVLHSPPPSIAPSLVLYKRLTNTMRANLMTSSSSHVAVSEPRCYLYTFTCPMVRSGTLPWFHFVVVLHTNSSKSLIACISTHHGIFFGSWRILLLSLEHFHYLWKSTILMFKPKAISQFPCQYSQYFPK